MADQYIKADGRPVSNNPSHLIGVEPSGRVVRVVDSRYATFAQGQAALSAIQDVSAGNNRVVVRQNPDNPRGVLIDGPTGGTGDVLGTTTSIVDNFPAFSDATGKNIKDSGKNATSFATVAQGEKADTALQAADIGISVQGFASVLQATTASFTSALLSKLNGIATGAEVKVNADWTAVSGDSQILNKPTLGTAAAKNTGTSAGNVPLLDGSGLLDTAVIPAVAITDVFVVASQSAMLALTAQKGDIAIRTDLNKTFALSTNSPSTLADWKELLTPTDAVLSVASLTGAISAAALKTALDIAVADITDMTANGRSLVKAANYAAMKALLDLEIGIDVQAYSAVLSLFAALTDPNADRIVFWDDSAGAFAFLTLGTGLSISGTTIDASGAALPTMIVQDQKTQGTDGGSGNSVFVTRDLNTVVVNGISGASLGSNQITLPIGTYDIRASCPAFNNGSTRSRLYNVTNAALAIQGTSENGSNTQSRSFIVGRIVLSVTTSFRLETILNTAVTTNGLGRNAGNGIEVYSEITITKVA